MYITCPKCQRVIRVFHVRDVDGGWFLNHKGANGEKCEMSLMPYPRPTQRTAYSANIHIHKAEFGLHNGGSGSTRHR